MEVNTMRRIKSLIYPVQAALLALVLVVTVLAAPTNLSENDPILGTWSDIATTINTPPGFAPQFGTVVSFSRDGNIVVTSNIPNVTIGQGTFVKTGQNTYTDTFYFFRPDPSSPLLLTTKVVENIRVSPDGSTYSATGL